MITGRYPEAVKPGGVACCQLPGGKLRQEALKNGQKLLQGCLQRIFPARTQRQRSGQGQPGKLLLVHIEADANHRRRNAALRPQAVLDEHAGDFLSGHVDVVGPLDIGLYSFGVQEFHQGHGGKVVETDALRCLQREVFEDDGEGEVLPRLREPAVSPLAAAGRLVVCRQDASGRQPGQLPKGLGIGGVYA